jgi:DNA mismatch repair protein MutS2
VFFEELYQKSVFAIVTTHYSSIKLKANELKNATNGCMLFDTATLKPKYEFALGQPGSSFTFEVAKMNGIKPSLIESAKHLLDDKKVKLDRLLNELQENKNTLELKIKEQIVAQETAAEAKKQYEEKKQHFEYRLKSQQVLIDQNNRQLMAGKKMLQFMEKFNARAQKKDANSALWEEIKNFMKLEKLKKNLKSSSNSIDRKKSKVPTNAPIIQNEVNQNLIKIGSEVEVIGTKHKGIVEKIQDKHIEVIVGNTLLKVERAKIRFLK